MSQYIRSYTKGATYFFTLVSYDRRKILCEDDFLEAFKKSINSDGTFTISVLYADTDNMLIDILITEEYSYGFMNQKGKTSCERTIRFKN